jgi:hypothetical protein
MFEFESAMLPTSTGRPLGTLGVQSTGVYRSTPDIRSEQKAWQAAMYHVAPQVQSPPVSRS